VAHHARVQEAGLAMGRPVQLAAAVSLLIMAAAPASAQTIGDLADRAAGIGLRSGHCAQFSIGIRNGQNVVMRTYAAAGFTAPAPDAEYEIGSVTKTFTAALLADAVVGGRMQLADPLQLYAPPKVTAPEYDGQPIELVHLATHTAGLPKQMPLGSRPLNSTTNKEVWQYLNTATLASAPGETFSYSNVGFALLGLAIVRHEGVSLEKLYKTTITGPLGMPDTRLSLNRDQAARLLQGYGPGGAAVPHGALAFPGENAAGALHSTLPNMMRYMGFGLGLFDVELNQTRPVMFTPRHAEDQAGVQVGLAWDIRALPSGQGFSYAKEGETNGFSSYIAFAPSTVTGAVVLTSRKNCPARPMAQSIMLALNPGQ
jgi:CubicO group peptidase (beta-lactamase class C family)